ncbi:hypothetical protein BO94DRAFT_557559 [Aspergillus sclerotioniger CBS 115572]|uniref:Protein kinase domain-containing protein n=1 Tax=Aspergillus sclerotioniger CBS 115572 TaxID=1450535 RepID=A0A317WEQ0_9EURO|nr:hypothetical protein BO94DRAFT_557559 [Aspergillus sclerotioniger CBS 115572]PWY83692.1 hypothetical protein BO94DRAFT_557559 [Aspergillus sclerotioniger CBS 115572]
MTINLSEVDFLNLSKRSQSSCVFHTRWRDKQCILKVYHHVERTNASPRDREVDPFTCEIQTYTRLKAHGLCGRGCVPDFYGVIDEINPMDRLPYLKDFLKDRTYSKGVLIEFIPNLRQIDLSTFSQDGKIHRAEVYHGDPYPRNMMVQEGSDRVLWIDFDRAQTYDSITPRQQHLLDEEDELMDYFVNALAEDYKEGKIHRTWECYYEYV